jgi:hypothetical protein
MTLVTPEGWPDIPFVAHIIIQARAEGLALRLHTCLYLYASKQFQTIAPTNTSVFPYKSVPAKHS